MPRKISAAAVRKAAAKAKKTPIETDDKLAHFDNPPDPYEVQFVRNFRWTFMGDRLPAYFVKSVKIDYAKQLISFSYHDIVQGPDNAMHAMFWADAIKNNYYPDEELFFSAYNGCGEALYSICFSGLKLVSHESSDYDYASSELSTTKITVSYNDLEFVGNNIKEWLKHPKYFIQFELQDGTLMDAFPVFGNARPSLELQETQINWQSTHMWLPGSGKWKPLHIHLQKQYLHTAYEIMNMNQEGGSKLKNVIVTLKIKEEPKESWTLQNAFIQTLDSRGDLKIHFNSVSYNKI